MDKSTYNTSTDSNMDNSTDSNSTETMDLDRRAAGSTTNILVMIGPMVVTQTIVETGMHMSLG